MVCDWIYLIQYRAYDDELDIEKSIQKQCYVLLKINLVNCF